MTEAHTTAPRQGRPTQQAFSGSVIGVLEVVALALMISAGLVGWATGTFTRGYDYDEVLRAHSIWLTSQGLRPYSDFFEVHPPYFVMLSPVVRAFADPVDGLIALRMVAVAGNLFFLGGLVALGTLSLRSDEGRRWAWLATALVAFNPYILDFLVEFRIDGWGYGLVAFSIFHYCRRTRTPLRVIGFGASTALASVLFCPKLVVLAPLIVFVDQIMTFESWRGFVRGLLAYTAGVGGAAAAFLLYLLVNRIGIERMSLMLGRYHAVSNSHAGFRYGLLGQIGLMRPLLALVLAGLTAGAWRCVRRRTAWGPYQPALVIWLLTQAFLVTYPYKQYYAPWFLFATGLIAPLGPFLAGIVKGCRGIIYVLACLVTIHECYQIARFWGATNVATAENELIRWMNHIARPEDRIVGSPPYHPIDRFDTFFLSFNTSDPKGYDSERIFAELPGLRPFVTPERYRAELDAHPPSVVVLKSPVFEVTHPATQRAVLEDYMLRHGYRRARVGVVWFALRPDRFEYAMRNGLLK
ncbi:MAG: hypothetical protein P4L84_14575 [Isosphaeraceae bacterium]|nr:hypothetical protein [Isosphaeraceae bacterium]